MDFLVSYRFFIQQEIKYVHKYNAVIVLVFLDDVACYHILHKLSSIRSKGRYSFLCFQEKDTTLSQNSMLFSLRYHIIPYSLYFFNLSFYPISEKRCTFAAQFMKDRNLVIQKHY